MKCTKYPERDAAGLCTHSGQPYCAEELVQIEGKNYSKDALIQLAHLREEPGRTNVLTSRVFVSVVAILVLNICVYAFALGNGVFEGKFENEPIAWYILAKGIFCALSLALAQATLTALRNLQN